MVQSNHDYAEVVPMFRRLSSLSPDTPEFRNQRDAIIQFCLPLADHIAQRFRNRGEPLEDLVQVARVGLINAVNRFDVETRSNFLSFAVPTVMGEVRRHFRDHGWSLKVPRSVKDLSLHVNAGTAELSHSLGRAPTATELANHLGVDRQQVVEALIASAAYTTSSTDKPARTDDDGRSPLEMIGSIDASYDKVLDIETVRPLIAALPERERTVLLLRFFHNMTQSQIAERIGASQMHVSRILARAISTLRDQAQPQTEASSNDLRTGGLAAKDAPRRKVA